MDQLLLTVAECCRITAIGRTKFYDLVASGEIPVRKLGKKTLVSTADLKQWAARLPTTEAKTARSTCNSRIKKRRPPRETGAENLYRASLTSKE
jgi:excisionase family DNA binding protein